MVQQVFTEQTIMNDTSTTSAFIFNRFHILRDQSLINIITSRKQLNITNILDIFRVNSRIFRISEHSE